MLRLHCEKPAFPIPVMAYDACAPFYDCVLKLKIRTPIGRLFADPAIGFVASFSGEWAIRDIQFSYFCFDHQLDKHAVNLAKLLLYLLVIRLMHFFQPVVMIS